MKYIAVSVTATAVIVCGGLAVVAVPRLLSTESTSTVASAATNVPRTEVEKQVRENYAPLPIVQGKPKAVSCAGDLKARAMANVDCTVTSEDGKKQAITVSVTKIDGSKISYDYVVLEG
ncbi:DUF4333 domain-containing protein [Streptomyces sp. NBC_00576]|uniref:DUF4333 domain-containing protein n=1 Tax=Streptomyces sp. NBC_00576 TaxID=2903665 RepID=UPI002E80F212|nr:DUF4333 domain-containing protein [Streptomyces sp. NBC_00576]WUB70461.1 DUF4333 domain-containing protein [Streptomyces sp. NBC_00576]